MARAGQKKPGTMAAIIGLDNGEVEDICGSAADAGIVVPANFNSPGQVVVAGTVSAVNRAVDMAKQRGAKRAIILPMSVPSHCLLMQPAAAQLAEALAKVVITTPSIPVIHNIDAQTRAEPDAIRQALVEQLCAPVRWVDCINQIKTYAADEVIECGPGKVLTGLIKRIDRSLACRNLNTTADFAAAA